MPNSIKPPSLGSTIGKSPAQPKDISKAGKQGVSVKAPKLKAAPSAFASPSQFFGKSEDFQGPKHPSLLKMWDFLNRKYKNS